VSSKKAPGALSTKPRATIRATDCKAIVANRVVPLRLELLGRMNRKIRNR